MVWDYWLVLQRCFLEAGGAEPEASSVLGMGPKLQPSVQLLCCQVLRWMGNVTLTSRWPYFQAVSLSNTSSEEKAKKEKKKKKLQIQKLFAFSS